MNHCVDGDWQGAFERSLERFQAGELADAESAVRESLAYQADNESSLYLLVQIVYRSSRIEEAIRLLERLIALNPTEVRYHNDLGVMFAAQGRWPDAESAYRMAVALDGQNADALFNLALALLRLKRPQDAQFVLQRLPESASEMADVCALRGELARAEGKPALAVQEFNTAIAKGLNTADVHVNLGLALEDLSRGDDAMSELELANRLDPDDASACFHLGNLHRAKGELKEAEHYYRRALRLRPDLAEAHNNLGLVLQAHGEAERAAACFENALGVNPAMDAAHTNLGSARLKEGWMEGAIESFRHALEINPESAEAWNNLGNVYLRLQRLDEAEQAYRRSLSIKPDYIEVDLNLGILLLLRGNFAEGWRHYESRWAMPGVAEKRPKFSQPEWTGESLDGRALLVYSEQGMGDNLQFVRYLPLLRKRYPEARIYFWCLQPLYRLFSSCAGEWGIEALPPTVAGGLPAIDYQIALLSLPYRFATDLTSIPAEVPYLRPPVQLAEKWSARLAHLSGKKVGLVWASGETYAFHKFRTVRLRQLFPLLDVEGISWVSLQKGGGASQIEEEGLGDRILDVMDEVEDFADTAAIIAHLDLVISVDTSVPHLAGGMGVPVWLLDRFDTDWRWLLDRRDSPWYPSMRIFRQPAFGEWPPVVSDARNALAEWVGSGVASGAQFPPQADFRLTDRPEKLKLNLGCGNRKMAGFINVDCVAACAPDLVVNLDQAPWPWLDDSVEEIQLIHVLEHLGQSTDVFLSIIKEMWRICCDGARIEIVVPHPRSDYYLGDPTHVRPVTPSMLNLFDRRLNREWARIGASNTPLGDILGVDFEVESAVHDLMPRWRDELNSGRMSEAQVMQAVDDYNNVVEQTRIVWRARKGRY